MTSLVILQDSQMGTSRGVLYIKPKIRRKHLRERFSSISTVQKTVSVNHSGEDKNIKDNFIEDSFLEEKNIQDNLIENSIIENNIIDASTDLNSNSEEETKENTVENNNGRNQNSDDPLISQRSSGMVSSDTVVNPSANSPVDTVKSSANSFVNSSEELIHVRREILKAIINKKTNLEKNTDVINQKDVDSKQINHDSSKKVHIIKYTEILKLFARNESHEKIMNRIKLFANENFSWISLDLFIIHKKGDEKNEAASLIDKEKNRKHRGEFHSDDTKLSENENQRFYSDEELKNMSQYQRFFKLAELSIERMLRERDGQENPRESEEKEELNLEKSNNKGYAPEELRDSPELCVEEDNKNINQSISDKTSNNVSDASSETNDIHQIEKNQDLPDQDKRKFPTTHIDSQIKESDNQYREFSSDKELQLRSYISSVSTNESSSFPGGQTELISLQKEFPPFSIMLSEAAKFIIGENSNYTELAQEHFSEPVPPPIDIHHVSLKYLDDVFFIDSLSDLSSSAVKLLAYEGLPIHLIRKGRRFGSIVPILGHGSPQARINQVLYKPLIHEKKIKRMFRGIWKNIGKLFSDRPEIEKIGEDFISLLLTNISQFDTKLAVYAELINIQNDESSSSDLALVLHRFLKLTDFFKSTLLGLELLSLTCQEVDIRAFTKWYQQNLHTLLLTIDSFPKPHKNSHSSEPILNDENLQFYYSVYSSFKNLELINLCDSILQSITDSEIMLSGLLINGNGYINTLAKDIQQELEIPFRDLGFYYLLNKIKKLLNNEKQARKTQSSKANKRTIPSKKSQIQKFLKNLEVTKRTSEQISSEEFSSEQFSVEQFSDDTYSLRDLPPLIACFTRASSKIYAEATLKIPVTNNIMYSNKMFSHTKREKKSFLTFFFKSINEDDTKLRRTIFAGASRFSKVCKSKKRLKSVSILRIPPNIYNTGRFN